MPTYQLAQLNIATLLAPLDSPQLAGFVSELDRINALAEAAPGFVWRLQDEAGDATALRPFGDDVLVNMSVWDSVDALHDYTYRSDHAQIFRRRRDWFAKPTEAHMVLWWVPHGHRPTPAEAAERLGRLQRHGPTPHAFSFRDPCPPPDAVDTAIAADAQP
ncbi:DUF3291 domain-containing protein [Jeongeupia wiesaeckerbachi]|uniref:DUF3291 domain-containing protein n=1 Tax=Jeongeupia wiesaeckerbachi TaxID=3051218 RepID=UPI003D802BC4